MGVLEPKKYEKALEAVICGVISLSSFFSSGSPCAMEWKLVEHAELLLIECLATARISMLGPCGSLDIAVTLSPTDYSSALFLACKLHDNASS